MVLFTDPKLIPDYLSPLEKNYNNEKKDRERHHSALKTKWQQEEAAVFTADDAVSGLQSLTSLSKTLKKISTEREEGKYDQFKEGWSKLDFSDTEKAEQIISEVNFTKKGFNLLKTLKDEGVDEKVISYIEKNSGRRDIRIKRLMGWQTVNNSVQIIDDEIEAGDLALKTRFDEASKKGDVAGFYRDQLSAKLQRLGLNNKFISTHYGATIDKFATAKGLEKQLDYKSVKYAQDRQEDIKTFENLKSMAASDEGLNPTFNTLAADTFNALVLKMIENDEVNGKSNAVIFFHRLQKAGKINGSVIAAMKKGQITGFDAGKTGESIFSQKEWRFIEQGEIEFQASVKADHVAIWTGKLNTLYTQVINNELNNEQLEIALGEAADNGMQENALYKTLSKMNANRQSEDVEQAESIAAAPVIESGNTSAIDNLAEETTNTTVKRALKKESKDIKAAQEQWGYSEKPITEMVASVSDVVAGSDGNYQLSTSAAAVNNDLLRFFNKAFNAARKDPNVLNPLTEATNLTKEYWERNGGTAKKYNPNQPDKLGPNDIPRGKFTATTSGEFKLFNAYEKRKQDRYPLLNKRISLTEVESIKTKHIKGLEEAATNTDVKGATAVERYLNTAGAILDHHEIKAAYENNQLSEKIIMEAEFLNVSPWTLLNSQYNAAKNKDPDVFKNLDESDVNDFLRPGLYIDKVLEEGNHIDLQYLIKKGGINKFSPKQLKRLNNLIQPADTEVESTIEQADLNFERNKRLQRLKTLGIKNVPASALESDEALDKFIAEQGGLEPQYTEGEL